MSKVICKHWFELILCFDAIALCVAVFAQMLGEFMA